MRIEKYHLKAERHFTLFEFVSEGPRGAIRKLVQFQQTDVPNFYNLAFGDEDLITGGIDDLVVTNNNDTEKVLATVVGALYRFFDQYPNAFVYATGSTKARTRLYRIGITRFYKDVIQDFDLYGQIGDVFYKFEVGVKFEGFLVQRKFM